MSKKAQIRKGLVNELRKAHFYMGFDKAIHDDSIYRKDYIEYPIEDKGQGDINLRATNYTLGTDVFDHRYKSINKTDYLPPVNAENAKLDQQKKNDLRSHHFAFGYDKNEMQTETKDQYTQKKIDSSIYDDKTAMRNFLRRHNHDFGDRNTYFNTVYDNQYNSIANMPKEVFHQGKTKDEITKDIVNLRKTNIVLGNDSKNFLTSNKQDFRQMNNVNEMKTIDPKLKETSYKLGTDKPDFKTNYQNNFFSKPFEKNDIKNELIKDLRSTHFSVGNDPANFKSESAIKFLEPHRSAYKTNEKNPELQKNHCSFGQTNQKDPNFYNSIYKNNFSQPPPGDHQPKPRDALADRGSNIKLGEHNENLYVSEHRAQFESKKTLPNTLTDKQKNSLKGHHNVLGIDKNDWISENHYIFVDKTKNKINNAMDKESLQDLKTNHFKLGFQKNGYSTSGENIGRRLCEPNRLNKELENDLKQHHFSENGGNDWQTIYKEQYIWKDAGED